MISIDLPMNNAEILVCYNTKENYPHLRAFSETEVMAATQKVVLSTKQPVWRRFRMSWGYPTLDGFSSAKILAHL